jgi:iron(III) transport system ATP-binding protein
MSDVNIRGIRKAYGRKSSTVALDNVDLAIREGELLVLLGPSGCGKTTMLRCLAGLETPDQGEITLGGRIVFDARTKVHVPPDKRNIGMVFQSYALWPHLTVRKNIEYPLRAKRMKAELRSGAAMRVAEMVECESLLDRYPAQLSGGQQQRVALARGLAGNPSLILFDEPLSNLDARLRDTVRGELHNLHRKMGYTGVYVTHDQSEAFALGDRIAVMRNGRIEQVDAPRVIFDDPATDYVAGFVGMTNRLELQAREGRWWADGRPVNGAVACRSDADRKAELSVRLRPDAVHVYPAQERPPEGLRWVAAEFEDASYAGGGLDVVISVAGTKLRAAVLSGGHEWVAKLEPGTPVTAAFSVDRARLFDVASGASLALESGENVRLETALP